MSIVLGIVLIAVAAWAARKHARHPEYFPNLVKRLRGKQ